MQTIEFAKVTSNIQKTEQSSVEEIIRRKEERIEALVSSRRMYRLEGSNIFYIESSRSNLVYYCRYIFGSKGNNFCSCKSFEFSGHKKGDCKHLDMIPIGIMKGKIIDVSELPKELKRDNTVKLQYKNESYDF